MTGQIKLLACVKVQFKLDVDLLEMTMYNEYLMRELLLTPSLWYLFIAAFVHMARNLETCFNPDGMPLISADGTRRSLSEEYRQL